MVKDKTVYFLAFVVSVIAVLSTCTTDIVLPPPQNSVQITAVVETNPVSSSDDAADDPVVWLNSENPGQSLVIGTDKQLGLESYSLDGELIQRLELGRTNNVDLRPLVNSQFWSAVAAASNRSTNTISLVLIDHTGRMSWLETSEIDTGLAEPYGLCMYRDSAGMQVFVNDTDGRYQQWLLDLQLGTSAENSSIDATLQRSFSVESQPEGCVADDEQRRLFVGVEEVGIYSLPASFTAPAELQLLAAIDSEILAADVEGMDIYYTETGGYLVASSQGNYSYAVYDRLPPFTYRGSFQIVDGAFTDGAQETDGLALHSGLHTDAFPNGILVVQDGFNDELEVGGASENQNFKLVSWSELSTVLNLP